MKILISIVGSSTEFINLSIHLYRILIINWCHEIRTLKIIKNKSSNETAFNSKENHQSP